MWAASPRHPKLKQIDPTLSLASFRKTVKDMPKHQSATLVQLRTGHIALGKHLHRIGKADTPVCPCCRREDETVLYFLLRCPAHAIARRALTQSVGRDASYIRKLLSNPGTIPHTLEYVGATRRFARQGEG